MRRNRVIANSSCKDRSKPKTKSFKTFQTRSSTQTHESPSLTHKPKAQGPTMKKFVLILLSSIALMMLAASPSSAQVCENCIPIPRADFELAKKAVDELKVARPLISAQAREIELLRENSDLKEQLNKALTDKSALQDSQLKEKDAQLTAEKAAREKTEQQLTIETREKEKAQRKAKFWRKVGTVAGGVAGALIFGAIR